MKITIARALLGLAGLLILPGCEAPVEDDDGLQEEYRWHRVCQRRSDYPTLLALGDIDLSGDPSVSGPKATLAANGTITVAGSADIQGDLFAGGDVVLRGNPNIDGDVESFSHTLQVADDPTMDFVRKYNNNWRIPCIKRKGHCRRNLRGNSLTLNSVETLTLRTGVYYFSDLQINGRAALQTVGNVWVFVDGDATFNGGATWNSNWDTLTLVSNSESTITINGAASAAMHVFAPHSTVKLAGTSGFAGSVIARDIDLSGTTDLWLTPGSRIKNCPPLDGRYDR